MLRGSNQFLPHVLLRQVIAECSSAIRGCAVAAGAVTALECLTTLGKVPLCRSMCTSIAELSASSRADVQCLVTLNCSEPCHPPLSLQTTLQPLTPVP